MNTLDEERVKTIENISRDSARIYKCLMDLNDLTPEGEIIREDLIGLLFFNNEQSIDTLMIERRKIEKNMNEKKKVLLQ